MKKKEISSLQGEIMKIKQAEMTVLTSLTGAKQ